MPNTEAPDRSFTATEPSKRGAATTGDAPVVPDEKFSRGLVGRYLLWLALPAVLLYTLPLVLIRLPSFEVWAGSTYGPALDYGFRAAGVNADVVIFGDSSALHGIDPTIMSKQLGVKVLNLPNTAGSLLVTDDLVLSRYLQSNRPPRLIVLYFIPWELNYGTNMNRLVFEGEEMLARYGSFSQIAGFARRHPTLALQFPFQLYSISPRAALLPLLLHQNRAAEVEAGMGHISAQARHHLTDPCQLPSSFLDYSGFHSVQLLADRYRSPQTKVLIFVAPIPACTNAAPVLDRPYAELPAAPPREMEPTLFLDDRNYAHLDPSVVPETTAVLTDSVRAALNSGSAPSPKP